MRKNINHANILIVEGEGDRSCLEQLCSKLDISPKILLPVTPKDLLDNAYNSKQGVYAVLKDALEDLRDSHLKRLAIIVDADQAKDGQSFQTTFDTIEQRLQVFDYRFDSQASIEACGLIFSHPDAGFHPIGVWIMPNNQEDGAIESWISACINNTELPLFNHATTVVNELSTSFNRTFEGNKQAKAEVATWLAWQKSPSIGLYAAVDLLDSQSSEYKNLVTWLNYVFPEPPKH